MERGRIQGLPKFFGYPLLSQERVKLRTSKFPLPSFPPPLLFLPIPSPHLPYLRSRAPKIQLGSLGVLKLPSGVWGRAPAEIEFGAFALKSDLWLQQFLRFS